MTDSTDLDALVAPLRSNFHAKRRDVAAQCEAISRLLESYLKAVDSAILRELAQSHSLPSPAPGADSGRIALDLLMRVQNLPELRALVVPSPRADSVIVAETGESLRQRDATKDTSRLLLPAEKSTNSVDVPTPTNLPRLREALALHPLVIVGGPPHLERLAGLNLDIENSVEWVDTTRQGTHAIGNLERRIRDRRISALLILEGLVQHRHSDPLVSTARVTNIPHAYGGKGGRTAIAQSLAELDRMMTQKV